MKLEVECTWNHKKNKAKQIIHFDHQPKSLFLMPSEKVYLLQALGIEAASNGPPILKELENIRDQFPNSPYANFCYHRALEFFEYFEESTLLFDQMKKAFPDEVFIKCILAKNFLQNKDHDKFLELFNNIEVLKGVFPKRLSFFCEEALYFHKLWLNYFHMTGDGIQEEKHKKFIVIIFDLIDKNGLVKN